MEEGEEGPGLIPVASTDESVEEGVVGANARLAAEEEGGDWKVARAGRA